MDRTRCSVAMYSVLHIDLQHASLSLYVYLILVDLELMDLSALRLACMAQL